MDQAIETHVFYSPPLHFNPTVKIAGCFCDCQGKILLLKRHPKSSQGNTWGIPAGKINPEELPEQAACRELFEETGLKINSPQQIGILYLRHPNVDFIFYLFKVLLDKEPSVNLAIEENLEAKWLTLEEAMKFPLIGGASEVLKFYQRMKGDDNDLK